MHCARTRGVEISIYGFLIYKSKTTVEVCWGQVCGSVEACSPSLGNSFCVGKYRWLGSTKPSIFPNTEEFSHA